MAKIELVHTHALSHMAIVNNRILWNCPMCKLKPCHAALLGYNTAMGNMHGKNMNSPI